MINWPVLHKGNPWQSLLIYIVVLLIDPSYEMVNRICDLAGEQLIFEYLWPEFPMTHRDCPVLYKDVFILYFP